MWPSNPSLPTQELAEFLAVVSTHNDPTHAVRAAVEQAALAFEAEVGAVVRAGVVISAVGFPAGRVPHDDIAAVASGGSELLHVPGAGSCHALRAELGGSPVGHLVVARAHAKGFSAEEKHLMRAMGRVLELTLESLHRLQAEQSLRERSEQQALENSQLLESLRERQHLLEHLARIQRAISRRAPLQQILDAAVASIRTLLDADVVTFHLLDPDDPGHLTLAASDGLSPEAATRQFRRSVGELGVASRSIALSGIVTEIYPGAGVAQAFTAQAVRAAMAAPVSESGVIVGSIVVASYRPAKEYTKSEQAVLQTFAEHVTLAVTDAKTLEAMYQAFHDSLTGLASRALFLDRLRHGLAGAQRSKTTLGLLFIDLDRFKMVNDTLGHAAGDQLLVEVADRVRGCLRASDTAARFGGDEFAVLLQDTTVVGAQIVADRIIEAVRAPYTISDREVFINASIGISLSDAALGDENELLRAADVAMYQAKRHGKGRHQLFEPGMHAVLMERLDLEADLRRAIDNAEFVLQYQPIVALDTGRIVTVEALVRWHHPSRGMVPPLDFIPLAEETGLILPLGQWVLEAACRQAADWQRERRTDQPLSVSVNLSARQLEQRDVAARVSHALIESGLDAACLVLEITESLLMQDREDTIATLTELRTLGIRLAIDDFGTGYSSLSYLRQFPIDILKIDKSFVDGIGAGPEASAFARAIVRLGQTLHLEMVAEGIEERAQVEELRRASCQFGQGYYFARPLPAEQISALLAGTADDRVRRQLPALPVTAAPTLEVARSHS